MHYAQLRVKEPKIYARLAELSSMAVLAETAEAHDVAVDEFDELLQDLGERYSLTEQEIDELLYHFNNFCLKES